MLDMSIEGFIPILANNSKYQYMPQALDTVKKIILCLVILPYQASVVQAKALSL